MAIDVNSNKYTFFFATVLVVVVATILAITAESLKPMQKENVLKEKQENILKSVGYELQSRDEAPSLFQEKVKQQLILDANGQVKTDAGIEPFDVDVQKDYKAGLSNIYKANADDHEAMRSALLNFGENGANYPLFVLEDVDGENAHVVPMVGTGLWGPVWGYIAIADDGVTVAGAIFDHKSETPGLGAEIKEAAFQIPFIGKTIFDENGSYTGVSVVKGGAKGDEHGVDAISGGTITSVGVQEMIVRTLRLYEPYFIGLQKSSVPQVDNTDSLDSVFVAGADSLELELMADSTELSQQ